jgi:hypothetical protein
MNDFHTWLKLKRENFIPTRKDSGTDYERVINDLTKICLTKYNAELMRLFNQLANDHNDNELHELLDKLSGEKPNDWLKPSKEPDEVVAPNADRVSGA